MLNSDSSQNQRPPPLSPEEFGEVLLTFPSRIPVGRPAHPPGCRTCPSLRSIAIAHNSSSHRPKTKYLHLILGSNVGLVLGTHYPPSCPNGPVTRVPGSQELGQVKQVGRSRCARALSDDGGGNPERVFADLRPPRNPAHLDCRTRFAPSRKAQNNTLTLPKTNGQTLSEEGARGCGRGQGRRGAMGA